MDSRNFNWAMSYIIIALFIVGCGSDNKVERIFKELSLVDSLELDPPLIRLISKDENFYGYDYYEKQIVKLNSDFEVIDALGGFGDGPKENLLVRNFFVLENDKIALFDTEKNTFKIQDFSDSVFVYHKFTKNITRGIRINDKQLLVSGSGDKMVLNFALFDLEREDYQPLAIINKEFQNDFDYLIYEGKLIGKENMIIYTPYFANKWFVYDLVKDTYKSGHYLHNLELPKVRQIGDGAMLENASELIIDSFILGERLAVLSNIISEEYKNFRALDIYDLTTQKYLESYLLPLLQDAEPDEGFSLSEETFGIVYEEKILFYKLDSKTK